jgi:ATP-binding cassette subfamily B protein
MKAQTGKSGIPRLLEIAGTKKWLVIAACVLGVAATFLQFFPAVLVYEGVMELVSHAGDFSAVNGPLMWRLALSMLACFAGFAVLLYISAILSHIAAFNILYELRMKLAEKLSRLGLGYFTNSGSGSIKQVMSGDVESIELFVAHHTVDMTSAAAIPVIALISMGVIDWRLALTIGAVVLLSLPLAFLARYTINHIGKKHHEAINEAHSRMLEYIGGIKPIKAFNMGGDKFQNFRKAADNLKRVSIRQEALSGPSVGLAGAVLHAALPAVMVLGAWLLTRQSLSAEVFIIFLVVCMRICDPLLMALVFIIEMLYMTVSARRIQAVMEEKPLPEPAAPRFNKDYGIRFDRVNFAYNQKQVLFDVSCEMRHGGMTALVGASGSGKSTITRLIARFWDADGGTISIGGIPVKSVTSENLLSQISVVFQDVYLFRDTIAANIALGRPEAGREAIEEAARAARCHDFITRLPAGYETLVGEGGGTLSGGEKQRVSIARAILKDAPIILLDEATASLDPENELLIQEALSRLVADKTLVVIAHRLQSVKNADRIIVLEEGRVAEQGTHDELVARDGIYARMWREQQKAKSWKFAAPALSA